MMDDDTNIELIDLSGWMDSLERQLTEANSIYNTSATPAQRQWAASGFLSFLVRHVGQLPSVRPHMACGRDLAMAFYDLTAGIPSDLTSNHVAGKGGRPLSLSSEILRDRAIAFVELLIAAGETEAWATGKVTTWLTDAGFQGTRKGGPIRQSTVRYWRTMLNSGDHPEDRLRVSNEVTNYVRIFGLSFGHWPPEGDSERTKLFTTLQQSVGRP